MAKKSIKIFFSVSIIVYILLGFYLWYSVYSIRSAEFEKAVEEASYINVEIDSAYSVDYSFSSKYFLEKTDVLFVKYPKLSGVIIDSKTSGVYYIKLQDSRLLGSQPPDYNFKMGAPELMLSHPFMKVTYTNLYFNNGVSVRSTLVFDLMDRSLFFPVLRNTLIIALLYLLLAIAIMYISGSGSKKNGNKEQSDTSIEPSERSASESINDNDFIESELELPPIDALPSAGESSSGMYSDKSGLVWEHFLPEKLDAELKRAASFDQDSCLLFISIISPSGFIPYRNISELIIEHFTYKDLAFESGDHTFCLIIPEKDIDEGQIEVEKFRKGIFARFPKSSYIIYAGLTSRNGRLLGQKRMIQEAKAALAKAEVEEVSTTIVFRTDLNKYRDYIASAI